MPSSSHSEVPSFDRIALRRAKIAAREALPPASHSELSARLGANLATLLAQHPPSNIGFCWPIRAEFDARPLVQSLLALGWHACLPLVIAPKEPLLFRAWTPTTPMKDDIHGIPHPTEGRLMLPHVLLIPVNACDHAGYRLGYGGGYFDRTLSTTVPRPLSIGVGFELCRVPSIQPQAHDIPLDHLVTEEHCYNFAR